MSGQFEVFITVDANLKYQQNLSALKVAIVVLRAHSNDLSDLLPLVRQVLVAFTAVQISRGGFGALPGLMAS
jgi:hypothetical protein